MGPEKYAIILMDDGIWDDDGIDDAMLIAASQMVETKGDEHGGGKRDSLDEATLSMLILEVENDNMDVLSSNKRPGFGGNGDSAASGQSNNRFLQTQTVFKPSQSSRPPGLMPPPKTAASSSAVRQASPQVPMEQFRELEAENVRLNKEKSSKMGEISVLREELKKRKAELDAERVAKTRLIEDKAREIKAKEEEAKAKIDRAVTERDFISHELDRTKEDLARMAKNHKLMSKVSAQLQSQQGPDPKKPRVTSPQRPRASKAAGGNNIPKSIDRTLLGLEEEQPLVKSEAGQQIDTKDTGCQTEGRANAKRKNKGRLCLNRSIGSTLQRLSKVTLDDSVAQKESFLLAASLSVNVSSQHPSSDLSSTGTGDPEFSEDMLGAVLQLIARGEKGKLSLKLLLEQSKIGQASAMKIVTKIKELVQAAVVDGLRGDKVFDSEMVANGLGVLATLVKQNGSRPEQRDLLSFVSELLHQTGSCANKSEEKLKSTSHVRLSVGTVVFTFLKKGDLDASLCSNNESKPCFLDAVCSCLSEEILETSLAQVSILSTECQEGGINKYERLTLEVVAWATNALVESDEWLSKHTCQACRRDLTKILALCCWCVVSRATHAVRLAYSDAALNSESHTNMIDPERLGLLERVFKQCSTLCLHRLKLFDEVTYVRSLAENPVIQRRYIWSFKQGLARLKSKFNITSAEEAKLSDLSVESDLSLVEDKKVVSRPSTNSDKARNKPR